MEKAFERCFSRKADLGKIEWAGRTDAWITSEVLRRYDLEPSPENCQSYLEAYLEILPGELRDGPQGQVLPGILELLETLHARTDLAQGLLTGNVRRGAEFETVVAASRLALGSGQRVLFTGLGVQEHGKIPADRLVAQFRHFLGRRPDNDVVTILDRQLEQVVAHRPADAVDLHGTVMRDE